MYDQLIPLTVKELRLETDEYLSLVFVKPEGFNFDAGECMDLRFPDDNFWFFKTFSFASSPTEDDLLISFKKGDSEYKKRLENLKNGDTMFMKMYGNMFHYESEHKSVFFAGGIGIAPFRSMLKFAIDKKIDSDVTLIYVNRIEEFPFKKELDSWREKLPQLNIHYIVTEKEGRLTKEKIESLFSFDIEAVSYVAGPPRMVDATIEILENIGIDAAKIKMDSFDGYVED